MHIPNFKSEAGSILYKDTVGRLISPRVADIMLSRATVILKSSAIHTVLDFGCGPGTLSIPVARQYPHLMVTAVDSSDSMIALVKQEAMNQGLTNLQSRTMDATHIDLAPESFDLALCNLAFPFFPRPYDSIRDLYKTVRPGGTVLFTVPGRHTWEEFFQVAGVLLGDMVRLARPFLSKFEQAEVLPSAMQSAGFLRVQEAHTRLPFHFENGQAVLDFFTELFSLLEYAPDDMKAEIAEAIDRAHPEGFTMHYEAVLLSGHRDESQQAAR